MSGTFTSGSITSTGPNPLQVSQVQAMLTRFEVWTERLAFIPAPGKPAYDLVDSFLRLSTDGSGACVLEFALRLPPGTPDDEAVAARIFRTKTFALSFNNLVQLDRVLKTVNTLFEGGKTNGEFEFEED